MKINYKKIYKFTQFYDYAWRKLILDKIMLIAKFWLGQVHSTFCQIVIELNVNS